MNVTSRRIFIADAIAFTGVATVSVRQVFAQTPSKSPSRGTRVAKLQERIDALRSEHGIESIWLSWNKGSPLEPDGITSPLATPEPSFSDIWLSEIVADIAVLLLVQDRKLDLDAKLIDVLKIPIESRKGFDRINLSSRSLRSMISTPNFSQPEYRLFDEITYALLTSAIASASNLNYSEYCQRNIFKPLGMEVQKGQHSWLLTPSSILRCLTALDFENSHILRRENLQRVLPSSDDAANHQSARDLFFGLNMRPVRDGYKLTRNMWTRDQSGRACLMVVEKDVPGGCFAFSCTMSSSNIPQSASKDIVALLEEVRS